MILTLTIVWIPYNYGAIGCPPAVVQASGEGVMAWMPLMSQCVPATCGVRLIPCGTATSAGVGSTAGF